MGLDFVDVMICIEDKFLIEIREGAEKLRDVEELCDWVEQKIREKNEGIESFPNISKTVSDSVHKILAEKFNIADTTQITDDLSLSRLADFSASPIPYNFWQQLRKIQNDDTDELKMIKSYMISCDYLSVFNTMLASVFLFIGITFWCVIVFPLVLGYHLLTSWRTVIALFTPSIMFFGIQPIFNWIQRNKKSKITVAEIINHIVKQKHKHSVRTDGQPYSRKEIEQGVLEILHERLSINGEITLDDRLVEDLGMG
ncbi:MAG: hypothetical protein LBJ00_18010 [Planctomycetaceae bacterium]|nr:hypothetical protein [Planctomycetaceae bacterium]